MCLLFFICRVLRMTFRCHTSATRLQLPGAMFPTSRSGERTGQISERPMARSEGRGYGEQSTFSSLGISKL
jgi:hypothetical protein